ncbi:MAG TPA: prolyl oligopeptidase family serine peptidase [Armatimonadota bacterium]|jgi:dipeptidyl aminopeptidase/acylaminoacyl peptidase
MPHGQPHEVAWVGDELLEGPIRGVVMCFHGLGGTGLKTEPDDWDREMAALGALMVMPYYGPWSWMNRQAREMVDVLIADLYAQHGLDPATVPLVFTGGSMGGGAALLGVRYTRHHPVACYANVPMCDLVYHFGERPDLPRTIYSAFAGYEGEMADLLAEHSPLHQVDQMPDIDYLIVQGDADEAVKKSVHADRMVPAMRERGRRVEYLEVPGAGHGGPWPEWVHDKAREFMVKALG